MMETKLPYPDFASEAEEADWLYEHREELDLYFSPMAGTVREMLLRNHDLILPDAYMSVPLSNEDAACVRSIAETSGLSAEEYLGQVVHEALQAKRAA
jgi:hypothetical protein